MKKILCLLAALCLLMSLAACNSGTPAQTTAPAATNAPAAQAEGYNFTVNGTKISMHAAAAPIVAALGEAKNYTEQTSCAFEGIDKTYYYGSFYMTTYPMKDADYVFSLWFADDSVTTEEGIYVGATQAAVEAAYGASGYNGSNAYIMTKGQTKLTIILEAGVVTSIQYDALTE